MILSSIIQKGTTSSNEKCNGIPRYNYGDIMDVLHNCLIENGTTWGLKK